jgi:uncharacterized surface protein with fasciclin (FAS1) repeats
MPHLSKRRFLQFSAAAGAAMLLSACGGGDDDGADIVERLALDPQFSLLVEAVEAAGLVSTLKSAGPFTVFAPTNDAFVALLGEIGLSKDAVFSNTELLTDILTYHVLGARVRAADIPLGDDVDTVQGTTLQINRTGGRLVITDFQRRTSNITFTDIHCRNGVIHRIDKVLLPELDIVQTAQITPDLSILVEAVVAANLAGVLKGDGPFTVFAPTNAAFASLLTELGVTKAALLANTDLLTQVLTYHVLAGEVRAADIPFSGGVANVTSISIPPTVAARPFTIIQSPLSIDDEAAARPNANIVATDVLCRNGVVHVIDRVILPLLPV